MVNGMFDLPAETISAMREIRAVFETSARALEKIYATPGLRVDKERAKAALDLIQNAKNVSCDAVILPHHKNV